MPHRLPPSSSIVQIAKDLIHVSRYGKKALAKNLIRARIERTDRSNYTLGRADDLIRFFQNEDVLDGINGELTVDCIEAVRVAAVCCKEDPDEAERQFTELLARRAENPPDSSPDIDDWIPTPSSPGIAPHEEPVADLSFDDIDEEPVEAVVQSEDTGIEDTAVPEAPLVPEDIAPLTAVLARLEMSTDSLKRANHAFDCACVDA
ncbi:MAG: hypothetical protein ABIO72_02715 [Patescibacteria group bacterium]